MMNSSTNATNQGNQSELVLLPLDGGLSATSGMLEVDDRDLVAAYASAPGVVKAFAPQPAPTSEIDMLAELGLDEAVPANKPEENYTFRPPMR